MKLTQEDHDALVAGEKVCGECDGVGRIRRGTGFSRRCTLCLGRGKYTYRPSGQRVAWDSKRKEWRAT